MAIPLTAQQESLLREIAASRGLSGEELASEVLTNFLVEAEVDYGLLDAIAEANRGEMIDHEDLVAWTRTRLQPK